MNLLIELVIFSCAFMCIKCDYNIGVGRADCTGPVADITFMGYANPKQKGAGLHLRQYARAFIIDDSSKRILYVTIDAGMVGIGLKNEILKRLEVEFPGVYAIENFILSATHTHSTPGGFLMDILFDITVGGFQKETFDALVDGIVNAVSRAHANITTGKIFYNTGVVLNANINRSPTSYEANSDKGLYTDNVDKELVQLKFVASDSTTLGVVNWFSVHPVSMNNTNLLVSSDNLGYASILLEKHLNGGALPGKGKIVAAFASTSEGDASPNTQGAKCIDTNIPCEEDSSTCDGRSQKCIAFGPGENMFESTRIIAETIESKALEVFNDANAKEITGPVRYIHQFIDVPNQEIDYDTGNGIVKVKGCKPALGYSFGAGTTDGPGAFTFIQGTTESTKFWEYISNALAAITQEDIDCHAPKPILLPTGRMIAPYEWSPEIIPTQLATIGDFVIIPVPGEFTTMSGRRMRKTIEDTMVNMGNGFEKVVIAGLSNCYTDYIATPDEYQVQRYEAASTAYGPYTLPIYTTQYGKLMEALLKGTDLGPGPSPPEFTKKLITFTLPIVLDISRPLYDFGACTDQPPESVKIGETVIVKFVSGHPRNDVMLEKSFLTVEKKNGDQWDLVATDACWETKFRFSKNFLPQLPFIGTGVATIEWEIPMDTTPGTYRISHFGNAKSLLGGVSSYSGTTNEFEVVPQLKIKEIIFNRYFPNRKY